jgi:hypothetical protein
MAYCAFCILQFIQDSLEVRDETMATIAELLVKTVWIAQTSTTPNTTTLITPETTSVIFSAPQFFIALVAGILLAFAFQLALTNLSVAAGISYLGRSSDSHDDDDASEGSGHAIRKISVRVGIWTLITVTIALFCACYLAVQLSLLATARLGAIVGLVIWAAYFSILVWVSSTAVGSLIGSVVSAATSGFQAILGTATAAIGGKVAKQQMVSTAEAVASAVKNEIGSGIDPQSIRKSIENYVQRLSLPGFDLSKIRGDFEQLLNDPEIEALAGSDRLQAINRQTFVDLISRRSDFTPDEVNRFADLLEGVWRQTIGRSSKRDSQSELVEYLKSAQPGQLKTEELNAKLDRILAERNDQRGAQSSGMQPMLQSGMNTLVGLLAGRTDLSDLKIEQILERLKAAPSQVAEQTNQLVSQFQGNAPENQNSSASSPIHTDVENYLRHTYSWQMNRDTIAKDFRNVLYDVAADPGAVIAQLSLINRPYFVEVLRSRGVFTQDKIQQIADQLDITRRQVLVEAQAVKERETTLDLRRRIENYLLYTPKQELYADRFPTFKTLLEDADAGYETLHLRLVPYDQDALRQILLRRSDITPVEVESILPPLEATRDRVLFESQSLNEQTKQRLANTQQKLEDYLRHTGKAELNPEGIKRDLQTLISDPQTGISALRDRASQFDRDTVVKLLSQRQDMNEAEARQIVDQVESSWQSLLNSPRAAVETVKDKADQTLSSLSDYLRRTQLEELDPEGIQRDLTQLLDDPKAGAAALRHRLSQVDRATLVKLLGQRQDLSEAQVNQIIDQVQEAIRKILRSPRRLALRAQQQVMDFETTIEDYLRHTDKDELNPDGIKRDLRLLVQSPQVGLQNIGDRFSQRQDISPEEAERIVAQIESTRDQILEQAKQIQYRIQEIIDRIFGRIRDYLNSLNRPELNYESITQDVHTLFDDPQAGFEALRTRLSHFDRQTLVALISSRKDISEADANRLIDQIESARTGVLQRAERIQNEAQRRVESVKAQAQRQMEETRKAAEAAAWWLFITALVSALASAGAGAIASS